jgi:hypothetical protein
MLVRAQVSGAVRGVLYLWGTPEIAERGGRAVLSVPDLQVAVETRDWLTRLKLAAWRAFSGGLESYLRARLTSDVTAQLDEARRALSRPFDLGEHARLRVTLDRVEPGAVSSLPGALVAHARLRGAAALDLR